MLVMCSCSTKGRASLVIKRRRWQEEVAGVEIAETWALHTIFYHYRGRTEDNLYTVLLY